MRLGVDPSFTPRSKRRALLPLRYASSALLAAALLLAISCFVILSKHRQYDRAQRQIESVYQAKLQAEFSAIESLNTEQRMLKDHLNEVTGLADSAKRATEECQRASTSISSSLAAKDEGARAAARRADAAEAARGRAEADAAASKAQLEAEVAELRSKVEAAEARAREAEGKLEAERKLREKLEADAAASGLLRHVPRAPGGGAAHAPHHGDMEPLLKQLARRGDVLLTVCDREMTHPDDYLTTWVRQAQHLGLSNALVMSSDSTVLGKVKALGMDALMVDPKSVPAAPPAARGAAVKWVAIGQLLELGYAVLYSDVDVALLRDPFPLLVRDSDLEAMSGAAGGAAAHGEDQPAPGEPAASPHRQLVLPGLSPGMLYLRPSPAASDLAAAMVAGLQAAGGEPEAALLDRLALAPAHGGDARGARVRVLEQGRFLTGAALFGGAGGAAAAPAALKAHGAAAVHVGRGGAERLRHVQAVVEFAKGRPAALEALAAAGGGGKGGGRALREQLH
ncbi:MAG: nucleotide-diphospho-sugar transferase-domain-containing protein [Monoraphidium minutum]|nr:MAG: nucleotide-diphospho-sugar transferase-domain-containing protein [Monoraphidium minutum]